MIADNCVDGGHATPAIDPLPPQTKRPLWSVMLPTFNCAKYLRQTLVSVLAQDPGPEQMQIEVVDDCSTEDDPQQVVLEVGRGRVLFYKKPRNEGAISNFNTCIARSQGQIIHILHGDDYVEPGFYAEFGLAFRDTPQCAAVFSRAFIVDENGELSGLSPNCPSLRDVSRDARELMRGNPMRTPAVAVKRSFYEQYGGFDRSLVHSADWDMWVRAIVYGSARMLNRPLACYRMFEGNDTNRLTRSAEHLRDCLRLAQKWKAVGLKGFDHASFKRNMILISFAEVQRFRKLGDHEAEQANKKFFREQANLLLRCRIYLSELMKKIERRLSAVG